MIFDTHMKAAFNKTFKMQSPCVYHLTTKKLIT
jgi:hypothetical protein